MIEVVGSKTSAKVFTNRLESEAESQIAELCNQEFAKGSKVRIMPDVHSGKGCVIGLTMTITDKVVPNLVGVDIGCGIAGVKIEERKINFERLEKLIGERIPSGFSIRQHPHPFSKKIPLDALWCREVVDSKRALRSIGTLGGGNHFLEVGRDKDFNIWFFVHSGSRNLGNQVAQYYQKLAINHLKHQGTLLNKDLAFLTGEEMSNYLHDVDIAQQFAKMNREAMLEQILTLMDVTPAGEVLHTVHNYVDGEQMMVRKGAISAREGELVMIPMNMRDGMLLCRGKGNPDWNFSAPHGAGRIMSRQQAKKTVSLEEFEEVMGGVWSRSVVKSTVDEAPMVYKPMEEILSHIGETVEVLDVIKPIYNYKAR